jgi:secondary thiamine-phosphate synthase enzyme
MRIVHQQISLVTTAAIQVLDITAQVQVALQSTGIQDGLLTLISPHTTARVNINEQEEMLQRDMVGFLAGLVPRERDYLHNRNPVDGRDNAHAHLLGLFMNASQTVPIVGGRLMLGGWQSIFFIELDGPRPERHCRLQFLGTRGPEA